MDNYDREPINSQNINQYQPSEESLFSNKNVIIMILLILLILSILGTTIFIFIGNSLKNIADIVFNLFIKLLSFFGYTTGSAINKTADVVGDTAKVGIDIAQGTVFDIGNIIKDASQGQIDNNVKTNLDNALNITPIPLNPPKTPEPTSSESPIQKPISASKTSWCLVGEYEQKRGCIEIKEHDKCLSGQVFPTQKMCLNPTMTPNV